MCAAARASEGAALQTSRGIFDQKTARWDSFWTPDAVGLGNNKPGEAMSRIFLSAVLWLVFAGAVSAQVLTGLARVMPEGSGIRAVPDGAEISIQLSQGVPYRVFTVDGPPRLVIDFSEADFSAVASEGFATGIDAISDIRFGGFRPGWSRLVADLAEPMVVTSVGMRVDEDSGRADVSVLLESASGAAFAAASGLPDSPFGQTTAPVAAVIPTDDVFTVVLDPGHGGVDPGAERDGLVEKVIALDFARVVQEALRRAGVRVVLTRDDDVFVSLEGRTAIAHQNEADVFVSLHADALSQGGARGATVYTLSEEASDAASALLAERHNRSDILAGVDLTGADDLVTGVLLDLARQETEPRSTLLAQTIIGGMGDAGGPMNRTPWRKAGFSVLKSADIPSVLVEIGFLSDARDRKNLADPVWRGIIAQGLADAILTWRDEDATRKQLVRQ